MLRCAVRAVLCWLGGARAGARPRAPAALPGLPTFLAGSHEDPPTCPPASTFPARRAGTYFPPSDSYGRPGFKTVLRRIAEVR